MLFSLILGLYLKYLLHTSKTWLFLQFFKHLSSSCQRIFIHVWHTHMQVVSISFTFSHIHHMCKFYPYNLCILFFFLSQHDLSIRACIFCLYMDPQSIYVIEIHWRVWWWGFFLILWWSTCRTNIFSMLSILTNYVLCLWTWFYLTSIK